MNEHELQRILRLASGQPEAGKAAARAGFADSVLARLPVVRFVIPGSSPGGRVLVLAGVVGLVTAAVVAWGANLKPGSLSAPPGAPGGGSSQADGTSLASTPDAGAAGAVAEGFAPQPKLRLFQPREPEYRPAAPEP